MFAVIDFFTHLTKIKLFCKKLPNGGSIHAAFKGSIMFNVDFYILDVFLYPISATT